MAGIQLGRVRQMADLRHFISSGRSEAADFNQWRGAATMEARWKRTVLSRTRRQTDGRERDNFSAARLWYSSSVVRYWTERGPDSRPIRGDARRRALPCVEADRRDWAPSNHGHRQLGN